MNKPLSTLWLASALVAAGTVSGNSAQAAPIVGKIGVGTWETQAEFADVKVVKGTTTLYQSDFTANQTGWTTSGGTWSRSNGYFRQTGAGTPATAWYGDTTWSDYTLTLRARKISGNEGFLITFGAPGDVNNYWWNLGGYGNTKHALAYPGTSRPENAGSIQTGVWYDIKVQISLNNVRCYLNGALIQESYRGIEESERNARIQTILNSPGFQLLTAEEKTSLQALFNRDVYLGNAARDTFSAMPSNSAFTALSAQAQVDIIRKVGAKQLTWKTGYGFDGTNLNKDNTIKDSMDQAVIQYNSLGVFEKHVTANNDNSVPNADGSYSGNIRFGSQYTRRCALHELSHTLGVGTGPGWYAYDGSVSLMDNDRWRGMYGNAQLSVFDGPGSVVPGSPGHILVYGENYDQESNPTNDYRHILLVAAMRRDMGVASTLWMPATTAIANGTYRLTPRHAPNSALDVLSANPNNSASIGIYTSNGQNNQKFLLDLQSDGSYRIRTALTGNRCVELPSGNTANGTEIKLWDNNGNSAQRWYFIPMGDGWYKIAPKNSRGKSIDIVGGPGATANGTKANSWDYFDALNQQWQLTDATAVAAQTTTSTSTSANSS
jgi:hypothetical protein